MSADDTSSRRSRAGAPDPAKLDHVVARARREVDVRSRGYREQSLRIHPWVCARCGREFTRENLRELTVHHKDHDHDNNPSDGSNWENLCIYCHENEHSRYLDHQASGGVVLDKAQSEVTTHRPFADLRDKLSKGKT